MKKNWVERMDETILGRLERTWIWRIARFIVGAFPLIGTLFFVVHVALLVKGYDFELAYVVCSYSFTGFLAWIAVSVAFQFNWMHRTLISYNYLVSFCIDFQREVGFGSWLMPARWFVLALGVVIVTDFVYENGWKRIGRIN